MDRIIAAGIYVLSLLPFWMLYAVADFLFLVLYRIIGYRKEVVRTNLKNAFPEKSAAERKSIEVKFYHFLSDMLVECIKMRTISEKEVRRRMRLVNPEVALDYYKEGQPIIGVAGHYANWELGILGMSMLSDHPLLVVYKPLTNKPFENIYNRMRDRFGAIMVPMKQTLRKIMEYKGVPHISIFMTDQTPGSHDNRHFIQFLNQETLVFLGPEKIARKTNYPMIYCHIDRVKRGYYTFELSRFIAEPASLPEYEITRLHSNYLEDIIRKKPELWLWSHRRWKHSPQA